MEKFERQTNRQTVSQLRIILVKSEVRFGHCSNEMFEKRLFQKYIVLFGLISLLE